ncbi:MAG: peptidylprolyl isomerase [Sphingobacteriaceae bacterium]|nr:peptidylprolyl isomerase [Sphingobacteriaceae bacterium]
MKITKFNQYIFFLSLLGLSKMGAQTLGKETVLIETSLGNMKVKLYEETPLHKLNFLKLVSDHVYDSLLFHRVINSFMIQGGDPTSKKARPLDTLGNGELGYTVPAEINPKLIHKKGTLCAAREGDDVNPKFASSSCQFYIVQGKVRSPEDLKKAEDRINKTASTNAGRAVMKSEEGKMLKAQYDQYKAANLADSADIINKIIESMIKEEIVKKPVYAMSDLQKTIYSTVGGTPHLDGTYTVFGEVIEGLEVIDKIASVKVDGNNRPEKDLRMKITLIK